MIDSMHCLITNHCNVRTEVRIAGEVGYQGIELVATKLLRYIDCGNTAEDLASLLKANGVRAVCINALKDVEKPQPEDRAKTLQEAERLCGIAATIGCPTIQVVPFSSLAGRAETEVLKLTARNLRDIADVGAQTGIRFQLELIAWSPIHSLRQALHTIQMVDRDNVGLVVDFWHCYAGEETIPDDVSRLDQTLIYGVHVCDGVKIPRDRPWTEEECRGYQLGEGAIPVNEWISAVKATGYDGVWSCELLSPRHWEYDLWEVALESRQLMLKYLS